MNEDNGDSDLFALDTDELEDIQNYMHYNIELPTDLLAQMESGDENAAAQLSRLMTQVGETISMEVSLVEKYYDFIPSGLPYTVGVNLAKLLEQADLLSGIDDQELAEKARVVCEEAFLLTQGLMSKRAANRDFPGATDPATLVKDAESLCSLLEESLWALKKLDTERTARMDTKKGKSNAGTHIKDYGFKADIQLRPVQRSRTLSKGEKEHIRIKLYESIRDWHPAAEDAGKGRYRILSPFRVDNTNTSFVIFSNGRAYDFARREGFDTIDVWARINDLELGDALRELANKYGMTTSVTEARQVVSKAAPTAPPGKFPEPHETFFNHPKHGKPSHVYCYKDLQGQIVGYVARYDSTDQDQKKQFCPVSFTNDAQGRPIWSKSTKGWNGTAPIYGLEQLHKRPDDTILIPEGEKAVDAGKKLAPQLISLTWQGGASNAAKADWSLLANRDVVLFPDADTQRDSKTGELLPLHRQPGMSAVLKIAEALRPHAASVKIVLPPEGASGGWDLADALEQGWTPEQVQEHIQLHSVDPKSIEVGAVSADHPQPIEGPGSERKWRPTDIAAGIRKSFDQAVEEGAVDTVFPFAKSFRNYVPSAGESSRACTPILVSVSDIGQVIIVPPDTFIDEVVRWYDTIGQLYYGEVNLSEDQLRALALRVAHRLPRIESEPLIFKRPSEPGYAWQVLNIDSNPNCLDLAAVPDSHPEADQFSMDLLAESCPTWHEQLTRMKNRLGFLCYLGCVLDLNAKPQQYLWLYGEGQDGKSSILAVLKRVLGAAAIATDWPANPNNFFTVRFEGRRVALVDEEPGGSCVRTDLWKRVTGSNTITIEPKGKQAYEIRNNLLIIVGSNNRPSVQARKADLRRLVVCELETYHGTPDAGFENRLVEEFSDFISLCQLLWRKFKGTSGLVPVDDEATRRNLEEINAEVSELLLEHFEIFDADRIKALLKDPACVNRNIQHTLATEINRVCDGEKIPRPAARNYLVGVLGLPTQVVSYSRVSKPRAMFGIVAKEKTRRKYCIPERSFDLFPACRSLTMVRSAE